MKKLFSLLGSCLLLLGSSQAATLNISNVNADLDGYYGVADASGTLMTPSAGSAIIGRIDGLTDVQVINKAAAGKIAELDAAFEPFGSAFSMANRADGAFDADPSHDTSADTNPGYGGSSIYVWFYKGSSRLLATEYLLVKLNAVFPTDTGVPAAPIDVSVTPEGVATVVAGVFGVATHDYQEGSGPLGLYQMISTSTSINVAPIAHDGDLAAYSGYPKSGTLSAEDENTGDTLTFSQTGADPLLGTVSIQPNGSYTYTANAMAEGEDTFSFIANDGTADSNVATVTVTITVPPPNQVPVAYSEVYSGKVGSLITGQVFASDDDDDDELTYSVVQQPASGILLSFSPSSGQFQYRANPGFAGVDSFTFKVNDGWVDSEVATIQIIMQDPIPSWVWIDGDNAVKKPGIYTGEPAVLKPGARTDATTVDAGNGISYHFGGQGYAETTKVGALNDLWKYDSKTGLWTWLSGSKAVNSPGVYEAVGDVSPSPGGRSGSLMWLDDQNNLWVFGGASTTALRFNDLWKYNIDTNVWTFISGGQLPNAKGSYVEAGLPDAENTPGARTLAAGWRDASGRLFVFGGIGWSVTGTKAGLLNDLWVFDPATEQWTWLNGGTGIDAIGVYGVLENASSGQTPGGRQAATTWVGDSGNLYLFGGNGRGNTTKAGNLNDLWEYSFLSNEWKWVSGSQAVNAVGVYGEQGVAAVGNVPGARAGAAGWVAADGAFFLFGGQGSGYFNDVWRFDPEEPEWIWVKGPRTANGVAFYGDLNQPSPSATPGARRGSSAFTDATGNLLLFAGANGANSNNDVWSLDIPNFPVVNLLAVSDITSDSATVDVEINPNGYATSARLMLIKLTNGEDEETIDLGDLGDGSSFLPLSEQLTGLEEGSRYAVIVQAESVMGRGQSIVRLFTTLGTPPPVVANFSDSESEPDEGTGTVNVEVSLTTPATAPFTLPFTVSGTASKGTTGDFVISPVSEVLKFAVGQSHASISVSIIDDSTLDDGETVILTLGEPTDESVTVGDGVHTLSIRDNESIPAFVSAPGPRLVPLGSRVVFDGTVTGSSTVAYQWLKTNKNISKATLPTYTLASAKLTDAGSFEIRAVTPQTPLTSSFNFGVVDTAGRTVLQAAGTAVRAKVLAAGTGLTFQWYKGNDPVQTGDTLTFASATVNDSGDYTCVVSMPGATPVTTGIIRVHIYNSAVTIPAMLVGNYVGVVPANEAAGAPLGGRLNVTVTTKGSYTAKLILGTTTLSGSGTLFITGDATAAQGQSTAVFPRSGLASITVRFTLSGNATTPPTFQLVGTLIDPATNGTVNINGYRNPWVAKPKVGSTDLAATVYEGSYTYGLELPEDKLTLINIPQGNGFGSLTVTTAGIATYAGRTADGGKFTVATIVGPGGELPFYSAFTLTQGYLLGVPVITPTTITVTNDSNGLGGTLAWMKRPADVKSKELAYREGFEEFNLDVVGGKWQPPGSGEVIAGLGGDDGSANVDGNTELIFSDGGVNEAGLDSFIFSILNLKTTGTTQTVKIVKNDPNYPNPNTVTFKLIAKPVGHFSGTFIIPHATKTLVRTAAFQGTFIRLTDGTFTSGGFFLLAQLPQPGQTVKTSPQLSGYVGIGKPKQ
ncbi:Kelch repeat-containing protein [Prosthecobacter fusiformis]|nr:kelch repeat-containing protein [Prosthecobacter fusiformis]